MRKGKQINAVDFGVIIQRYLKKANNLTSKDFYKINTLQVVDYITVGDTNQVEKIMTAKETQEAIITSVHKGRIELSYFENFKKDLETIKELFNG